VILQHKTMMMLLFISTENPMWDTLIGGKISEKSITDYIGITRATTASWKRGGVIGQFKGEPVDDRIFKTVRSKLDRVKQDGTGRPGSDKAEKMFQQFVRIYGNHRQHRIYDAGKALDVGATRCQIIIDTAIYDREPIFRELYYDLKITEHQRNRAGDFAIYKGVYYLWVLRIRTPSDRIWLRCTMRVRYLLKIRDGYVIRCKLNAPIISTRDRSYWEYDGFIVVRTSKVFWKFERRQLDRSETDYFYFISCAGQNYPSTTSDGECLTLSGEYLTVDQVSPNKIVTGGVVLQKLNVDLDDEESVTDIMHLNPKVLTEDEAGLIDRLIQSFNERKENSG